MHGFDAADGDHGRAVDPGEVARVQLRCEGGHDAALMVHAARQMELHGIAPGLGADGVAHLDQGKVLWTAEMRRRFASRLRSAWGNELYLDGCALDALALALCRFLAQAPSR